MKRPGMFFRNTSYRDLNRHEDRVCGHPLRPAGISSRPLVLPDQESRCLLQDLAFLAQHLVFALELPQPRPLPRRDQIGALTPVSLVLSLPVMQRLGSYWLPGCCRYRREMLPCGYRGGGCARVWLGAGVGYRMPKSHTPQQRRSWPTQPGTNRPAPDRGPRRRHPGQPLLQRAGRSRPSPGSAQRHQAAATRRQGTAAAVTAAAARRRGGPSRESGSRRTRPARMPGSIATVPQRLLKTDGRLDDVLGYSGPSRILPMISASSSAAMPRHISRNSDSTSMLRPPRERVVVCPTALSCVSLAGPGGAIQARRAASPDCRVLRDSVLFVPTCTGSV